MIAPIYGRICDTGQIMVRASVRRGSIGDPHAAGRVVMSVEVWTSAAFGAEQRRGHCMEVEMDSPVTSAIYMDAYRRILSAYNDYFRECGATTPQGWTRDLAVQCGEAMESFVGRTLTD